MFHQLPPWVCIIFHFPWDLWHLNSTYIFRLNFTLKDLAVTCPAYSHFTERIDELESKQKRLTARKLSTDFPKYLQYDRVKELVSVEVILFVYWFVVFYFSIYLLLFFYFFIFAFILFECLLNRNENEKAFFLSLLSFIWTPFILFSFFNYYYYYYYYYYQFS